MKLPFSQAAEPLRDSFLDLFRPEQVGGKSEARQALQRLMLLRLLVTVLSVAGAVVFHSFSPLAIPILELSGLVVMVLLSIVLGFWRLNRPMMISQKELFAHLVMDVVFLIVILFYTGGASNPLISYLLVLLAVAATLFSQLQVNIFALGCVFLYTSFLISELRSDHTDLLMMDFQLHLVGMWVTFVVSAGLITAFVTRMASAIRSRELTLAKSRENEMRNEQLVAIGTLAAGTAHALGTPLSTMSVLLTDLDKLDEEELRTVSIKPDITLLRQQVTRCKDSLNQLTEFYNKADTRHGESVTLASFLNDLRDYIVNIHPKANVRFIVEPESAEQHIASDLTVRHAVINIIENAIKAATQYVNIIGASTVDGLEISVQDDGPGIPAQVMESMGEPFISTRKDSMGLGIFLANAAIHRCGGTIEMFNLKTGGAMSIIRLPRWHITTQEE